MENSDGNAWVFDSLVGFLHGPVWNVPLQTFIEEKSLPFEPTDDGEVPDRPEYQLIHTEYRNLVDVMLGSFMDDIGISAEQFEDACKLSAKDLAGLPAHFHRRLFEQIWAANDYDMFVKMMTHKNVELQLQALELIERQYGTMPNIFSSEVDTTSIRSDTNDSDGWPDCDDIINEIKRMQLLEENKDKEDVVTVPQEEVIAEKKSLISKLQSFSKKEDSSKLSFIEMDGKVEEKTPHEPIKPQKPPAPLPPAPKKTEVSDEEIQARQEYLKQQRDKLLALKKQVREKRLGDAESNEQFDVAGGEGSKGKLSRPRSASVAHAALAGVTPAPPPDAMQLRRALASKLKTEVVDTNV